MRKQAVVLSEENTMIEKIKAKMRVRDEVTAKLADKLEEHVRNGTQPDVMPNILIRGHQIWVSPYARLERAILTLTYRSAIETIQAEDNLAASLEEELQARG